VGNSLNITLAFAIGASLCIQPPINVLMARTLGSPLLAASVSIAISFLLVVATWLIGDKGTGDLTQIRALPWWVILGGMVGVAFVAGSVLLAPPLGIALFFVCVVAGQLLGATLVDHLGAFGMAVKPISATKVFGLALVLVGAAVVHRSNG